MKKHPQNQIIDDISKIKITEELPLIHSRWMNMISRCYRKAHPKDDAYYCHVTVCNEWLLFSNFMEWMIKQDWKGKELDKDLLSYSNNIYSPKTCIFISKELNQLIAYNRKKSYSLPVGVHFDKSRGKFKASLSMNGRTRNLGRFNTIEEASNAYICAKIKHIESFYQSVPIKVQKGLERHVKNLLLTL